MLARSHVKNSPTISVVHSGIQALHPSCQCSIFVNCGHAMQTNGDTIWCFNTSSNSHTLIYVSLDAPPSFCTPSLTPGCMQTWMMWLIAFGVIHFVPLAPDHSPSIGMPNSEIPWLKCSAAPWGLWQLPLSFVTSTKFQQVYGVAYPGHHKSLHCHTQTSHAQNTIIVWLLYLTRQNVHELGGLAMGQDGCNVLKWSLLGSQRPAAETTKMRCAHSQMCLF